MLRYIICAFLLAMSASVTALESSDAGTYAVIHRDGHVTDFVFFISFAGGDWRIERRNNDGSWNSVTCKDECRLQPSSMKDIGRFFPSNILDAIVPACFQNMAFAFCAYTPRTNTQDRRHLLVLLISQTPVLAPVKKLSNERIAP